MSFDGFTSEGVITDAGTGAVTVTNLTSGRHIVRVEKDGVATIRSLPPGAFVMTCWMRTERFCLPIQSLKPETR